MFRRRSGAWMHNLDHGERASRFWLSMVAELRPPDDRSGCWGSPVLGIPAEMVPKADAGADRNDSLGRYRIPLDPFRTRREFGSHATDRKLSRLRNRASLGPRGRHGSILHHGPRVPSQRDAGRTGSLLPLLRTALR